MTDQQPCKTDTNKTRSPSLPLCLCKLSEYFFVSIVVNHNLCSVTFGFTTELRAQIINIGVLEEMSVMIEFVDKL
jgi:hypothetical protein